MNDDPEQLDQYVEDILQDHRPERTPLADQDALGARQTAAMLHAAKPGAGLPSSDFLTRMQGSIGEWVKERSPEVAPRARPSRRSMLLAGASGLAAGVAAAVGVDQLMKPKPPVANQVLVEKGAWQTVKSIADLPEGTPVAFRSGAIEGFLVRNGQEVKGLSAVCTHMGCILNYSKFRDRFECPCHGATFEKDGQPSDQYASPLPRLPSLQVRVTTGKVQVYTV
ncbi:MAG: Rieske (2Fe-2S) protein [Candidatus Dormibacteraeota bacterium]|nr:Rieske (2Fe-2S) protein [Candidatus Dormibacteraeota bacterium]